ncbi:MAG: hypothetical protein ACRELC_03195 [Gemmatimonadota bacterium]
MSFRRRGGVRDLQRALRAYVMGHDRIWEAEREPGRIDMGVGEPQEGAEPEGAEPERVETEDAEPEWSAAPPRFGVPVPDELAFHRGPSTWRAKRTPGGPDAGARRDA